MAPNLPPPERASKKMKQAFFDLKADEDFNARAQKPSTESMFYDHSAPGTVNRRLRARANFHQFCEVLFDEHVEKDMYARDTLIDRVCHFLEGMARASNGMLQEKIQMRTLVSIRQSLQWWIKVLTPGFSEIADEFDARVSRHIHYIAVKQQLSTEHRDKNNLGELELEMFLDQIKLEHRRVPNLKQHYVAWVLAFMTGSRPGSFTVSSRYRKGAPMGGAAAGAVPTRSESHTLRWSDIDFFRMPQGIACNLKFRFTKGHQDVHAKKYVLGKREWLFIPKNKDTYLDLSVLIFLLAYERGLFQDPIHVLLGGENRKIGKDPDVNKQAVFVSANTEGELMPDRDMGYNALNPQLQQMCRSVGLFGYNNMYAFRREAAVTTKDVKGLAAAQELLAHTPSDKVSYVHYDPKGFGRRDVTAHRLGGPEVASADIRRYFAQATSAWKSSATREDASTEIKKRVAERLQDHEEYAELENTLEGILVEAHELLQGLGRIATEDTYGQAARNVAKYRTMLQHEEISSQAEVVQLIEKLDAHLSSRKTRRRDIKAGLVKEVTSIMQNELDDEQKVAATAPQEDDEAEEDEELDQALVAGWDVDGESFGSVEQANWMVIEDKDEETDHAESDRSRFMREWLNLVDSEVQRSGIKCYLCQVDRTISQETKDKRWILAKYHTHLLSKEHSRRSQLRRAFQNTKSSQEGGDQVKCPLCDRSYKAVNKFLAHVESEHPEQLWEKEDADGSDGEVNNENSGSDD